jgi:hypothetical protein
MKCEEFGSSRGILLHGVGHLLIYHCDFYKPSYISVHFLLIQTKRRISQLMYSVATTMMPANHAYTYSLKKKKIYGLPVHALGHTGPETVQRHSFLTLSLDGSEESTSRPGRFTSRKNPTIH